MTISGQRRENLQVRDGLESTIFAAVRKARNRQLDLPALQINIRPRAQPLTARNGTACLKIPLNRF